MFWLSRLSEHSTYAGGLLGPMMLPALGMGLTFVPLSLVALAKVPNKDAGVASSLLNTGQQVGGSIGLAILGTVAWSRGGVEHEVGRRGGARTAAHLSAGGAAQTAHRATTRWPTGSRTGTWCRPGSRSSRLVIALVMIRIKREDMEGIDPMAAPVDTVPESADAIPATAD